MVVNVRNLTAGWQTDQRYVYIGRPGGNSNQHFGNPFTHKPGTKASVVVGSRQEAVQAFDDWLDGTKWQHVEPARRLWILSHLHIIKNKNPVCWCAPKACHGDVPERRSKELS